MKGSIVGFILSALLLELPISELAELQSLSDEARRARFDLPMTCVPRVSAMRPATSSSARVIVVIACHAIAVPLDEPKNVEVQKTSE